MSLLALGLSEKKHLISFLPIDKQLKLIVFSAKNHMNRI